jgi:glycosyltransferase involved in cell wall biosynthesis
MAAKILHVSCAFGGGIVTSVTAMARNYPEAEHHLLAYIPPGAHIPITEPNPFVTVTPIAKLYETIQTLRKTYKKIAPDFVHLHSSLAGGFGRISFLPREKLIYTPHCYVFEHTAMPAWKRISYLLLENICSLGKVTIAGVSPRECNLAQSMIGRPKVFYLPNYADIPIGLKGSLIASPPATTTAVMIGRLLPQKDPQFFIELQRELQSRNANIKLKWIGGGEDSEVERLTEAGIEVTGWLDHHSVLRHLADADVYLHTAAWEGLPMSLLEAAYLERPIIVRDIPALRDIGIEILQKSPEDLADALIENNDSVSLIDLQNASKLITERFSASAQRAALKEIYSSQST